MIKLTLNIDKNSINIRIGWNEWKGREEGKEIN